MAERDDLDAGYGRVRAAGLALVVAAGALTAVAVLVDLSAAPRSTLAVARWAFLAVAVAAGFVTLLFHNQLASGRPLRTREGDPDPERRVPRQVASLAIVLAAIPFSVLLLGFVLRVVFGGSVVDYLGFLGVTLALWALFFPRRTEYEEWVRMRSNGEE